MKKSFIYAIILLFILFVDFYSKEFIDHAIRENESVSIAGNFIRLTKYYNHGTTFGLFKDSAPHMAISIVKSLSIIVLIVLFINIPKFTQKANSQFNSRVSMVFLIGGSLGNIIDRLSDKRVTDFIDIGIDGYRWYVFNFADFFQVFGGIMLLFFILREHGKQH
jgi:signal peptidase II